MFGAIGDGNGEHKLTLSEAHQKYINTYTEMGVKTIVVLVSGRPLVTTDEIDKSDAFVVAWLPGSEGDGNAEVLFADYILLVSFLTHGLDLKKISKQNMVQIFGNLQ